MKKIIFLIAPIFLLSNMLISQVNTIANYDFNSSSSYPVSPTSMAPNITSTGASSEAFQNYTGVATTTVAFVQNATAGNAIAMTNSSGNNTRYYLFQLGGSDLNTYSSYKVYIQPQRSTTGATLITVAYSTNGSSYTNFSTTYPVSISFTDVLVDLSSVTALNNASSVYIKLMVSGASAPTGTIRIDNFQVQATKGNTGGSNPWTTSGNDISFLGNISTNGGLNIGGNAGFSNSATIGGALNTSSLNVTSNAVFSGGLTSSSGFMFDNSNGIKYIPNANGTKIMKYGNGNIVSSVLPVNCAANPNAGLNHQFGGGLQIFDYNNPTTSGLLNLQTWTGGSSIDASTSGQSTGGLLLNYFCGSNVFICTGQYGGNVSICNGPSGGIVSLGKTRVGNSILLSSSPHYNDAQLTVGGKLVAKEIYVVKPSFWSDFVFAKNYKLLSLEEVEKFYKMNHHLPDVPSEEKVMAEGVGMAEMDATLLRKIEELTLYIVQQNNELKELKAEMIKLKNQK
ncbi:MAG: hypothetical protein HY062_01385 [Bacteroidetes bacterium]|nr:hypothetical protein [Bacteroidota bacterium]